MSAMTARQRLKFLLFNSVPGFAGRYPYYGTLVHFPKNSVVIQALCANGLFEPEIVSWLVRLARPNSTVFDVGANLGLMSIPVLRTHSTCRVVSFEPSPNSLQFLRRTAAASPYADRWTIVGKAVADRAGDRDFDLGPAADALYDRLATDQKIGLTRSARIQATTLDDEWQSLGRPEVSVIKIDVEGAESLVLKGARALLKSSRPAVILEWHQRYLDRFGQSETLVEVAREFGYRIYAIPSGVPVDDDQALWVQMNVCSNFVLLERNVLAP